MTRNTKRKLAIFIGTSKCLVYAEAKYCASEMPGEVKYYECSRTEYCCAFGCCVSPGLHFHHLWYYWILVIIMFLVCSGGGWWYRYWLQGRYRAAATAIPNRTSNARAQNSLRNQTCQPQQARISYNSARNTVLLHRMWKGPQRNGTSATSYNGNATTSTHYQNMNVVLNDANCPYYQLYGPPPSYETVIAQARGKASSTPTSPEAAGARINLQQGGNVITNPSVPQCFAYPCSPARLNVALDQAMQCQTSVVRPTAEDHPENSSFVHYPQYCGPESTMLRQNLCIPSLEYHQEQQQQQQQQSTHEGFDGGSIIHGSPRKRTSPFKMSAASSELTSPESVATNYEIAAMSSADHRGLWDTPEHMMSQVHGKLERYSNDRRSARQRNEQQRQREERKEDESREETNFPEEQRLFSPTTSRGIRMTDKADDLGVGRFDRRFCGGSFKLSGRYSNSREEQEEEEEDDDKHAMDDRIGGGSSHEGIFRSVVRAITVDRGTGKVDCKKAIDVATRPSQTNPSNNVILECSTANDATSRDQTTRSNADSFLESKRRLDRSKSLD